MNHLWSVISLGPAGLFIVMHCLCYYDGQQNHHQHHHHSAASLWSVLDRQVSLLLIVFVCVIIMMVNQIMIKSSFSSPWWTIYDVWSVLDRKVSSLCPCHCLCNHDKSMISWSSSTWCTIYTIRFSVPALSSQPHHQQHHSGELGGVVHHDSSVWNVMGPHIYSAGCNVLWS